MIREPSRASASYLPIIIAINHPLSSGSRHRLQIFFFFITGFSVPHEKQPRINNYNLLFASIYVYILVILWNQMAAADLTRKERARPAASKSYLEAVVFVQPDRMGIHQIIDNVMYVNMVQLAGGGPIEAEDEINYQMIVNSIMKEPQFNPLWLSATNLAITTSTPLFYHSLVPLQPVKVAGCFSPQWNKTDSGGSYAQKETNREGFATMFWLKRSHG